MILFRFCSEGSHGRVFFGLSWHIPLRGWFTQSRLVDRLVEFPAIHGDVAEITHISIDRCEKCPTIHGDVPSDKRKLVELPG